MSEEAEARALLAEVYRPEGVELWMNGHLRSLGGECPLDLIRRGEGHRVFARIRQLVDGNF